MEDDSKIAEMLAPIDLRVGQALRISQGFEASLKLLHMLIDSSETQASTTKIDDNYSKKTLGQLFRLLKQRIEIPEHAQDYVFEAVEMRNIIAHEFWNDPNLPSKLDSAAGRERICEDLESLTRDIRARDLLINELINQYLDRYGTSVDKLKDEATRKWGFLRGEE